MTSFPPSRVLSTLAAVFVTFLLAAAVFAVSAHANKSCTPPKYPGNGYFTSLSVSNTSCKTGGQVAVAWYHCRLKHGVSGSCKAKVLGFSCSEKRDTIKTEFDARVTCHKGRETVVHTYEQFT